MELPNALEVQWIGYGTACGNTAQKAGDLGDRRAPRVSVRESTAQGHTCISAHETSHARQVLLARHFCAALESSVSYELL